MLTDVDWSTSAEILCPIVGYFTNQWTFIILWILLIYVSSCLLSSFYPYSIKPYCPPSSSSHTGCVVLNNTTMCENPNLNQRASSSRTSSWKAWPHWLQLWIKNFFFPFPISYPINLFVCFWYLSLSPLRGFVAKTWSLDSSPAHSISRILVPGLPTRFWLFSTTTSTVDSYQHSSIFFLSSSRVSSTAPS